MTALDSAATAPDASAGSVRDITGIVQVSIPVTDLARSAAWYSSVLDLQYAREFSAGDQVTGCGLADFASHYMVALRLRSTTTGDADLRGEHPLIVEATDADAAERIRSRADALGIPCTAGSHADGNWLEFIDPDGIALRVIYGASGQHSFFGVRFTEEGEQALYATPRLSVPERSPYGGSG
ncbi:MAG: VOC family protein [Frankiaceae bacterium]